MQNRKIKSKRQGTDFNLQSSIFNPKAFTLVEVIIFIVVAGIVTSTIFIPLMTGLKGSMFPEKVATATYLAQYKMEELTKNKYDLVPIESESDIEPGFPDYQRSWDVEEVDAASVRYKLILVRVSHPDIGEIKLETWVTRRPADESI